MMELAPDELARQQREFFAGWKQMTGQNLEPDDLFPDDSDGLGYSKYLPAQFKS